MSRVDWIICEATSRWASAVRQAVADDAKCHRLQELRHSAELSPALRATPHAIVAMEVRRDNLEQLLDWLPTARHDFPSARFAALVERTLAAGSHEIVAVLLEAGIQAATASPRQLGTIVALAACNSETPAGNLPFVARLWARLPWQAV